MVYTAIHFTFNYGACTGLWKIHIFCINVHNWSYIYCSNNKTLVKSGRWTNYATQTGNWEKYSVLNLRVLLCSCVVQKATSYVDTKESNMCHQSQNCFGIYSLEFHNIRKGTSSTYLVQGNIFFTCRCIWQKNYIVLAYTPRSSSEAPYIWPAVLYIPYNTTYHEQTDNIINFHSSKRGI